MNLLPNPIIITLKQNQPDTYESAYKKDSQRTIFQNGHQWTEITYIKDHHLLWQFGWGLTAFVATVGTLIIGLFLLESIRNLWKKALSGKEIVIVNKEEVRHIDQLFKTRNPYSVQNEKSITTPITEKRKEVINLPLNELENNKKEDQSKPDNEVDQKPKTLDLENHIIDRQLVNGLEESKLPKPEAIDPKNVIPQAEIRKEPIKNENYLDADQEKPKSPPQPEVIPVEPENVIPQEKAPQRPVDDERQVEKAEILKLQPQKEHEKDLLQKIEPKEQKNPIIKQEEEIIKNRVPNDEFLNNYLPTKQDVLNTIQQSLCMENISVEMKNGMQAMLANPALMEKFLKSMKWQKLPPIFEYNLPKCDITEKKYLLHAEERKNQEQTMLRLHSIEFSETIEKFKRCPYSCWLGRNGVKKPDAHDFNLEQKDFNKLIENAENRIAHYYINPFLKIGERMEMIEQTLPQFFLCIQMQDFEEAWQDSGLRIILLTKEEFSSLKQEQVNTLNARQKELYEKRKAFQR